MMALFVLFAMTPSVAFAQNNPSGLALPRFESIRAEPVNIRVGPGTRYEVAWVYVQSGQPVEIIQEFDTWRKIRDVDGEEGWVHQSLLNKRRAGFVTPWDKTGQTALLARKSADGKIVAWLSGGLKIRIEKCAENWCAVRANFTTKEQRVKTYSGYIPQAQIWGVYPDEVFE